MTPNLEIKQNTEANRFEAFLDGTNAGIAAYQLRDNKMVFTHTEVPAAFEGQGIGSQLIKFALDTAREQGHEIVAVCPFVKAYMQRHKADQA